jgi:hypothetical protein
MSWLWPENPEVKYMLAASVTETPADPLKWLMQTPEKHTVVTRNLASHYELAIGNAPRCFILAPAYLTKKEIVVYGPPLVTDLLYAKTHVSVRVTNTPLPFSVYKRVRFTLGYSGSYGADIGYKALRYTLHEFNRTIGTFPIDESLQSGGVLHIEKTRHIRFTVEPEYAHLIALI